jgi:HPt (histidine-containing phosphotransfer) domain-containing protein
MNDYISKPIKIEAIAEALKKYGARNQSRRNRASGDEPIVPSPVPEKMLAENLPAIDIQVLQELRNMAGNDADRLIADLIHVYLEDAPERLRSIADAVDRANTVALKKTAHALRSLSVSVGALYLGELCQALESLGKADTIVGAEALVVRIAAEYKRVVPALQQQLPSGG